MGAVIELVTRDQVDEAWEAYTVLARKVADDPGLLVNRPHMEDFNRAHERWKRLFLRFDEVDRQRNERIGW